MWMSAKERGWGVDKIIFYRRGTHWLPAKASEMGEDNKKEERTGRKGNDKILSHTLLKVFWTLNSRAFNIHQQSVYVDLGLL